MGSCHLEDRDALEELEDIGSFHLDDLEELVGEASGSSHSDDIVMFFGFFDRPDQFHGLLVLGLGSSHRDIGSAHLDRE